MSGLNLNAISENASRLGMRLQESISEHTRDLAIARGASSVYLDASDENVKNIAKQLDSSSDREKLHAMKKLVALISKGRNVSEYFAQVVKNVASQNLEIRKLVYIYLLRYAEQEPDLALLSINTFQKDLTDTSPLIRAMALRVLSGIKVPMIGSIVVLAIKKCAADVSPYVRKAAALAIPKCYKLDTTHLPALVNIIIALLPDRSPLSIGSVAVAFEAVCPTRLDLLHPQYRRLCRILIDVDEWGQVDLLGLLTRYARTMLPKPVVDGENAVLDPDLRLLLTSSEPLFQSRNPAVVLAVTRVFYYVGPASQVFKSVNPLLRLLHLSKEVESIVIVYILVMSRNFPNLFSPFYSRFLVCAEDIQQVKRDKVRLLLNILTIDNHQVILREFIDYADDVDDQLVSISIRAIGHCAHLIPESTTRCLTALMTMIKSRHDVVVTSSVLVLKSLVQSQLYLPTSILTQSPLAIISHLAHRINDIRHPHARACVLWLVGQYSPAQSTQLSGPRPDGVADWATDVLRRTAKSFCQEESIVKLQIITLAAKLLVLCPTDQTLHLLNGYVFSLARYDRDYDVRDRGRMLKAFLAGLSPSLADDEAMEEQGGVKLRREQVRLILFDGKVKTRETAENTYDEHTILGSLGVITGQDMHRICVLPDWLEEGTESSLRDTEDDNPPHAPPAYLPAQRLKGSSRLSSPVVLTPVEGTSPSNTSVMRSGTGSKVPWTDLDKFYEDGDSTEEESAEDGNSNKQHSDDEDAESVDEDSDSDDIDDNGEE